MRHKNIETYLIVMAYIKTLKDEGLITEEEFIKVEEFNAKKYDMEKYHVYRYISGYVPSLERICKQEDNHGS